MVNDPDALEEMGMLTGDPFIRYCTVYAVLF